MTGGGKKKKKNQHNFLLYKPQFYIYFWNAGKAGTPLNQCKKKKKKKHISFTWVISNISPYILSLLLQGTFFFFYKSGIPSLILPKYKARGSLLSALQVCTYKSVYYVSLKKQNDAFCNRCSLKMRSLVSMCRIPSERLSSSFWRTAWRWWSPFPVAGFPPVVQRT